MRSLLLLAVLAAAALCLVAAAPDAAGPIAAGAIKGNGKQAAPVANPPVDIAARKAAKAKKAADEQYRPGTDFMGRFGGVPMNPREHLQRSLKEDKLYVASILRAPLDLGDPTDCKHSDIVKDEKELRKIALRINHRRVSLRQQQHWIDAATEGLRKIEAEIASSTDTARNLAEQLDALTAQKNDITAHVRRAQLLKELDNSSSNLMRLKDARLAEEIDLQKKHNERAVRNAKHNDVLDKLNHMRTKNGLALGKLHDPKPYRFAQVGLEAAAEEQGQAEAESEESSEASAEGEAEQETEASEEQQ
jgi:hypothetical protein